MATPAGPGILAFYGNQPVIVQQANTRQGFSEKNAKTATVLGALQLAAGFLAVVFQATATGIEKNSSRSFKAEFVGCGIWCGIMFMITGLLGIVAGRKKNSSLTVAFLACNIIVSVIVWVLVGFAAANLAGRGNCSSQSRSMSNYYTNYENYNNGGVYSNRIIYLVYYYTSYFQDDTTCGDAGRAWQAMDILLSVLAIFEFATAVTSAAYCCRALSCCCQESAQPVYFVQQSVSGPNGTYLCGPPMQPTFFQQDSSVQASVFANPLMVTGQVGYSTEVSSAQGHLPMVQAAGSSNPASGASNSNAYYSTTTGSCTDEQLYTTIAPSEPPVYDELDGTFQQK